MNGKLIIKFLWMRGKFINILFDEIKKYKDINKKKSFGGKATDF